jgi:hypothetical protein
MEEAPGGLGVGFGLDLRGQGAGSGGDWLGLSGVFVDQALVAFLEAWIHAQKSRSHLPL